ncbi:MAG: flagellar basal body L-ring protein FlgH [Rhizobiaceae bacterium]
MNRAVPPLFALALLAGCSTTVKEIGKEPALSPVGSGLEREVAHYADVPPAAPKKFSLWNDRQSRLFTDPRALSPGDILTVKIRINDRARFKNESGRSRTAARSLGLSGEFGWGAEHKTYSGSGSGDASATGQIGSKTSTAGAGATERSENLDLLVAAVVTDVLPNGNLMIRGSQEVRVNAELRVLTIAGIVRPQDIGAANTISYERIAEARIAYGGRGRLTEVQQPPYGQQILDTFLPF